MVMRIDNERGFALVVAIFALVVVGALVAGAFFVGMQEQRLGRNAIMNQQAFQAAETGIEAELAEWNAVVYNAMAPGDVTPFGRWLPDSSGWYRGRVRRMNDMVFFIEAEGFSRDSASRAHLGMLTRLRPLEIEVLSALQTQGDVVVTGNATITGANADPPGWLGCPAAPDDTLPGIMTNDTSAIKVVLSGKGTADVEGDPQWDEDPSINDSSLTNFGDYDFNDLRQIASLVFVGNQNFANSLAPTLAGAACATGNNRNWGEPETTVPACQGYYPIIYIDGDATINGDRGQGVLIVDGSLDIQGGFRFAGPVLVREDLSFQGSPGQTPRIDGGVIAANVTTGKNAFAGNASIGYSFCAIEKALAGGSVVKPMRERSWVNLY